VVEANDRPAIFVIAGANGAGKSSILMAAFAQAFDPDRAAIELRATDPILSVEAANSLAWRESVRLLRLAIDEQKNWAFETTLGGNTITRLLVDATTMGCQVKVMFTGLESSDLHVARVKARAARGGHSVPEDRIRKNCENSLLNLIRLLPGLSELRLFDNSADGDPATGLRPQPRELLRLQERRIVWCCPLEQVPEWAKPVIAAAFNIAVSG
jgi:predicted ABC-type ATPase